MHRQFLARCYSNRTCYTSKGQHMLYSVLPSDAPLPTRRPCRPASFTGPSLHPPPTWRPSTRYSCAPVLLVWRPTAHPTFMRTHPFTYLTTVHPPIRCSSAHPPVLVLFVIPYAKLISTIWLYACADALISLWPYWWWWYDDAFMSYIEWKR